MAETRPLLTGKLAWVESNTPFCDRSQRFYSDLFCWQVHPIHVFPFGILPTFSTEGESFGHVFMAMGTFARSEWLLFLSADIEHTVPRVEELGGEVVVDQRHYPGWAKTATILDPNGTAVNLIALEAGDTPDPAPYGSPVLYELWAPKLESVKSFYADLFKGSLEKTGRGYVIEVGGVPRLSLKGIESADQPAIWVPWFKSRSVGADQRRAVTFGAIPRGEPEEVGEYGSVSLFVDPVGSFFGIFTEKT